jgi:hypothetical protein
LLFFQQFLYSFYYVHSKWNIAPFIHSFLKSVLDGGELSASRVSCFTFLGTNV